MSRMFEFALAMTHMVKEVLVTAMFTGMTVCKTVMFPLDGWCFGTVTSPSKVFSPLCIMSIK